MSDAVGTARAPGFDVAALRAAEFPWTADTVYLNNASIGPIPERTRRVLDEFNRHRAMPHELPDSYLYRLLADTRRLAAELINADVEEIALATNTGYGINVAARGLPLEPGSIVLVSDREFPANVYPWMQLADRGVRMELVPATPEGWPDEPRLIERMADPAVRVLAVSLVQFSDGYRVDLDRLSAVARATGTYLVVDAIQGLGHVPVDVGRTPVDVLAAGAQKWLLSPWGSGFVYVRRELIGAMAPPVVSWLAFEGTDDYTRLTEYPDRLRADARRFELVTLPFQAFAGMAESLRLLLEIGVETIGTHVRALHEPVRHWAARRGVTVRTPADHHGSAILSFTPGDPAAAYRALRAAGVVCSLREGAIRLAPHVYNTVDELARVADVLDRSG